MGASELPKNVELHGNSLRIKFWWCGRLHKVSLRVEPTPANVRAAARKLAQIEAEIVAGSFDYARRWRDLPTPLSMQRLRRTNQLSAQVRLT